MTLKQLPIALWLVVLLGSCLVLAAMLRIDDDLTVFLPTSGAPVEDLLFTRLREGPAARLILVAFEGGTTEARVAASKIAAERLASRDDLVQVSNGEQAMSPETFAALVNYRYLLADAGLLDAATLDQALAIRKRQLRSPFAKIYAKEAGLDPTGLFRRLLVSWRDGTKPPPHEGGVWVSPDGSKSLLLLETANAGYTLDRQVDTVLGLEATLSEIAREQGVGALMSGSPVSTVKARESVRAQMLVGSAVAVAMVIGFLFWVYRSFRILVLGALPIITGGLVGLVSTLVVFGSVHRITLAFGVTLLGIAIDYPLHLFSHTHDDERLGDTARRIMPPMLLGASTTIAAFAVLGTGGFAGLTQLALFIASGLMAAVATAMWVLPSVAGDRRLFAGAAPPPSAGWIPPAWLGPGFLGVGALAFMFLLARGDAVWERDLSALSPVPNAIKVLDGQLRADLGAPDLRYLFLISGEDANAMLQTGEALEDRLQSLRERGVIGGFDALHRYLPSETMQRARQAALPDQATLEADLRRAAERDELDPTLFRPFLDGVETSRTLPPLSAEEGLRIFQGTPLWPRLVSLMAEQDGRWYGFVPLSAVQDLDALKAVAADLDHVDYVDLKEVSANAITTFRDEALLRLMIGLAVITMLLLLVRREFVVTFRILLAMASALVITAAALLLLGEKFSLFHILASLVVIGVGLDYGLFFSWKADLAEERRRAFHGVAICAISTTIVFALLAFSSISVLRVIGLTVALGTCLTFVSCYLLIALPAQRSTLGG